MINNLQMLSYDFLANRAHIDTEQIQSVNFIYAVINIIYINRRCRRCRSNSLHKIKLCEYLTFVA